MWHIAAAPLLARFDRSFVISIEYCYTCGSSLSLWRYAESVGSPIASRFHGRWRRQVPCSSRSSCPVYVVVVPMYFPQAPARNSRRDLEEVASAWITEVYRGRANRGRHIPSEKLKVVCRKVETPIHVINADPPYLCVFLQCLYCDPLWMDDFVGIAGRLHCNHAWLLLCCWCVYGSPH